MGAEQISKSDNYIQLKENEDILKLRILDEKGNDTGEMLVFNLEDIELPLRLQKLIEEDKKNRANLRNQYVIIDKKQDHKGKKLFSANEEARIKATRDFFIKEVEIYNMFLGERGVQKLLNGASLSWSSLEVIDEIITEQIVPKLTVTEENIKNKILQKYGKKEEKRDDIIE